MWTIETEYWLKLTSPTSMQTDLSTVSDKKHHNWILRFVKNKVRATTLNTKTSSGKLDVQHSERLNSYKNTRNIFVKNSLLVKKKLIKATQASGLAVVRTGVVSAAGGRI